MFKDKQLREELYWSGILDCHGKRAGGFSSVLGRIARLERRIDALETFLGVNIELVEQKPEHYRYRRTKK
jgi:hypothetical protein